MVEASSVSSDEIDAEKKQLQLLHFLDSLIYDTEEYVYEGGYTVTIKLIKRCSEFREHIVSFNNAVSFTSEKIDKLDDSAVLFIYRIQGQLHYYLGSLHAADGHHKMFM